MTAAPPSLFRRWLAGLVLLLVLGGVAFAIWTVKQRQNASIAAQAQAMGAPPESVTAAVATAREHRRTTTAIGTVAALQSITLYNELPGTVAKVALEPGRVVEPGTVLVALDVSVEQAELDAQKAEAALAETMLQRMQRANEKGAAPAADVDRSRAERDIALAQVARLQAIIDRKTIKAPFRARIGMADLHLGQFLPTGTYLTTLQGIDEAVHIDFMVTQTVAAGLRPGDVVEVFADGADEAQPAKVVAVDARVDEATRNAEVRARLEAGENAPAPGASVRVRVPVGQRIQAVSIPVTALRRGPQGDHVWLLVDETTPDGQTITRARLRLVQGGSMIGDEILVLEGLSPGERVAATGSFKLYENAMVLVMPDAPPTAVR